VHLQGYAGRTELPDNLKAILRPISMMVPDMALIAEIMLFSEGFVTAKLLSKRLTGLFELMQQQMSKQDHYDYGLRNTKSILVAAGAMKRSDPKMQEDVLLYRTIRDMQMPKLIAEDVPLFNALNGDFFPGLEIAPPDYGEFQTAIENALAAKKLQKEAIIIKKMIQIYEVKLTRHGNMLVGQSCSGKSTAWTVLQDAMNELKKKGVVGYESVKTLIINPKSLRDGELYGEYDLGTGEWLDGVLSRCMRDACADDTPKQKWLVLDGPVDTLWIESMNTVLDDNKLLTLVSGERIAMPPQVSLLFEVQDLAVASPATVSRAGMVYFDPIDFTWKPFAETWLQTLQTLQPYASQLKDLLTRWVDPLLQARRNECAEPVPCIELNLVRSLCNLLDSLCTPDKGVTAQVSQQGAKMLEMWFIFALFWSIGGGLDGDSRGKLDIAAREIEPGLPSGQKSMHDWIVDSKKACCPSKPLLSSSCLYPWKGVCADDTFLVVALQEEWVPWADRIASSFRVGGNTPFYKILVPTVCSHPWNPGFSGCICVRKSGRG
jgi:dynein heavy chain